MTANNNARPWEWQWWKYASRQDEPGKLLPPFAPSNAQVKMTEAEDSAAVRRIIEQLPPEDRAGYLRNLQRWAQLTIQERETLRRQASERRQRIIEETENALRESGLHLDDDHREVFMLRYRQERRKLERELQEKIAAERARRTTEIIDRLKQEFEPLPTPLVGATTAGPTVTAVPTLTPPPHP